MFRLVEQRSKGLARYIKLQRNSNGKPRWTGGRKRTNMTVRYDCKIYACVSVFIFSGHQPLHRQQNSKGWQLPRRGNFQSVSFIFVASFLQVVA